MRFRVRGLLAALIALTAFAGDKPAADTPFEPTEAYDLRDVEGWSPMEVTDALDITDGNQRVLLHRARTRVRNALAPLVEVAT